MVGLGIPELLIICLVSLIALIVIAGIGLVGLGLLRRSNTAVTTGAAPRETPLDILKGRYARGELTQDQFEQMRKDLES